MELTEDETEEGPAGGNVLAPISEDSPVYGKAAWTPIFSSTSRFVKGQVWNTSNYGIHRLNFLNYLPMCILCTISAASKSVLCLMVRSGLV